MRILCSLKVLSFKFFLKQIASFNHALTSFILIAGFFIF